MATALITNAGLLHPAGSSIGYPSPIRFLVLLLFLSLFSSVVIKVAYATLPYGAKNSTYVTVPASNRDRKSV